MAGADAIALVEKVASSRSLESTVED
jgi:hypothetical protein